LSKLVRWFLRIVVIVVVVLVILAVLALVCLGVYQTFRQNPLRIENLDERLPLIFHFNRLWVVWVWIIGLQAVALGLGYWVIRLKRGHRAAHNLTESGGLIGRSPGLDEAWKEIEVRSGPGLFARVYLMLTPSEDQADALLDASGLHIETRIPRTPSLLRASLTSGATFLTCVARPPETDPDAPMTSSSVEYACERLRAAASGRTGPEGVVLVLPVDWLIRAEAPRLATAYRGDLQAIARILSVRPPVYVVVTGMESQPGFLEFAHRMTESFRTRRRCGFYLPGEPEDAAGLVHGGLVWFSGWYQTWMLYLMANEPVNQGGNNALFTFGSHIRRFRRRLPDLLGTAIAAPAGGEKIPLHGCYFAGTGPTPETMACAAGIIRGRVLDNAAATRWAARAIDQDQAYRRAALAVGLVGGSTALLVWAYIALGIGSLGWLGLAMPAALVAGWIITLLKVR
jgi:IcmF-related N-terminal domain